MKRLIVTADDFGLTESVNRGVIKCHREGIVTSTSLMANGGAFEDAVARAKASAPNLGIGVHLNLTEGVSVAKPSTVSSLLNREGRFAAGPVGLGRKIATGRARLDEIDRELRAQIEKHLAAGVKITHLDGHKHVQLLPKVFEIAMRLASEYRISGVRCAAERFDWSARLFKVRAKQIALTRALSALARRLRKRAEHDGLKTPEHFFGIAQTGCLDEAALVRILNRVPDGDSELMCHPGYVDGALARTPTRLLQQREAEIRALTAPAINQLISRLGIKLITYRELDQQT